MPNNTNSEFNATLSEAEKKYLDSLDIIVSKLSPLWIEQLELIAPDFGELLKRVQNMAAVHKSFYQKLDSDNELGDLLLQLIKDIKVPYRSYNECYISKLNQRQDIVCMASIQQFLKDINLNAEDKDSITLETLFYAPLQQLKFYKSLLNMPNTNINQHILLQANQLLDEVMPQNALPPANLELFHTRVDSTKVIDVLNGHLIENYQMSPLQKVLLCDTFSCIELSKRVRAILTVNHLVLCSEDNGTYSLIFPPIDTKNISIKTVHIDRELIGEYNVQFWLHRQKTLTMKVNSKEERNMWLGIDKKSSLKDKAVLSWLPLNDIVAQYDKDSRPTIKPRKSKASLAPKPIRTEDIFTFYTDQTGEISPLVSSDESEEEEDDQVEESQVESDKKRTIDENIGSSFSDLPKKSLPAIPSLPLELLTNNHRTPIISGTKSLPTRNQSLKKPPIPSSMISSGTPNSPYNSHPSTVRAVSAYEPTKELPVVNTELPVPQNAPQTPPKKSFMRSVMEAVSNRSSLRHFKSDSKLNMSSKASARNSSLGPPTSSLSAVSLDRQSNKRAIDPALLHSYSAAESPPALPQHLALPPPQSPFAQRSSFISNQSTPSFTSVQSTSQSSLTLTPPLSRASSPGSMTPVGLPRYPTPSTSSAEDLGSPPESPDITSQGNAMKSVLYSHDHFKVFHWKDESWYTAQEDCLVEVRQTHSNRSCVAVHIKNTGQLYLNAWVLPDTLICRTTDTDLSLSLHITNDQSAMENYLFHCESKAEADQFTVVLEQMHQESVKANMVISATSTLRGAPPTLMRSSSLAANNTLTPEELAKTFKLAMQCKCKLYVQSASSKWSSFGSVYMKVSQQYTTKKMHVAMESHKGGKITQLVSAMVQSRNVERLGPKRISFLMVDELEKNSVVYMVQVREEATGDKILEYVKTKNAENGW